MSESDLKDALKKITWANEKINILHESIRKFIETKPYRVRRETNAETGDIDFIFEVKKAVPDDFDVETGHIIHALRSSLDHLTYALALRNGVTDKKKLGFVQFPFSETEFDFAGKTVQARIEMLHARDQAIIRATQPYRGGNTVLYSLNWLARKERHRELVLIGNEVWGYTFTPSGEPMKVGDSFTFNRMGGIFKHGERVGTTPAATNMNLEVAVDIVINEIPESASQPLIGVLYEFSRHTSRIMEFFR